MSGKAQNKPRSEAPVSYAAIVKAVNSGDSLVLLNQQGKEKEVFFSNVKAPRFARNDQQTDEDWAFASREFLRKLCIGQQISFTVEHKTDQGREYGTATMGAKNISREIVANGWASVKLPDEGKKARNELHDELISLYLQAKENAIGIFQPPNDSSIRRYSRVSDQSKLFEEIKGSHTGTIEYIRDGTTFRVTLPGMHRVYVRISGAEAPGFPKDVTPSPVAVEAKAYVERFLLHRDVNVTIRSPGDKEGEFYGTIAFQNCDVAEQLIKQGMAKFVAWNAPPQNKDLLCKLESEAKQKKLRYWKNFDESSAPSPSPSSSSSSSKTNEFIGKLREVRDGGNFVLADNTTTPSKTMQITLSSITVPKCGIPNREDEPYGYEAKEFIRKQFIGKKLRAELDYIRPANKGADGKDYPEREYWSVYCDSTNLAIALVENGLAKVAKANSKDGRSPFFEDLIIAEKSAQAQSKNIWNKNAVAPMHRYSDLTVQSKDSKARARQFLPFFQRTPNAKLAAVVDFVLSPNRVKLYVPKENCMIVLGFEGIKLPKTSLVYQEALEYVKDKLQQRDVQITVNTLDKVGSFIGNVFIQKKNISTLLLEAGYAILSETADMSQHYAEFRNAEEHAKSQKKKHWVNYSEEAASQNNNNNDNADDSNVIVIEEKKPKAIAVTLAEIVSSTSFYVHLTDEKPALEKLMADLNAVNYGGGVGAVGFNPKKGDVCVAKYAADGLWYRVKVKSSLVKGEKTQYNILYIDYGNEDYVTLKDLRAIPPQFTQSPPFARLCFLAYAYPLNNPSDEEEAASQYLHELFWDKPLLLSIEYKQANDVHVAIGDGKMLANVELVSCGLLIVAKKGSFKKDSPLYKRMLEEQENAKKSRFGLWRHGDCGYDSD